MPKGLYYCGTCERFTRRKRGHKGRCKYSIAVNWVPVWKLMRNRFPWRVKAKIV